MGKELEVVLAKVQADTSTPETELTATDYQQLHDGENSLEIVPMLNDVKYVRGFLGQDASIPGSINVNASLTYQMNVADTIPQWAAMMEAAGFAVAEDVDAITITPISELLKAATIWAYTGKNAAGASFVTKAGNVAFDVKISGETGKVPTITFSSGKGTLVEPQSTTTKPSVTKADIESKTPAMLPVTVQMNGNAYKLLKMDFEAGNSVQQAIDGEDDYGFGESEIESRSSAINLSVYMKADKVNPMTALMSGQVAQTEIEWGAVGKQILLTAKTQIVECKESEANGYYQWDCKLKIVDNEFSITIDKLV